VERIQVMKMTKIVLTVEGMMCGMCESHINDSVRTAFPVKKVTSSHKKGQTVILTEQEIDENELLKVIDKTGYTVTSVTKEPYVKKGLFSFGKF
jgi:copper chaperone CopZ